MDSLGSTALNYNPIQLKKKKNKYIFNKVKTKNSYLIIIMYFIIY